MEDHCAEAEELVEKAGPPPFITKRVFRRHDGSLRVWKSRHHRKALSQHEHERALQFHVWLRCLWMPRKLNWWIGIVFAIGSILFGVASVFSLPPFAEQWSAVTINAIYFSGSIPFTTAAYLQLFQAANAPSSTIDGVGQSVGVKLIGFRPHDIGWLSCGFQFIGTILFNFNTFDAMIPGLTWSEKDLVIWAPNIVGSILFLASGYLAFIESCHSYWGWNPRNISWWVVFVNLLGCVGFMVSACFSILLPGPVDDTMATLAVVFTLQGALCFLLGSLLMLPETAIEATDEASLTSKT